MIQSFLQEYVSVNKKLSWKKIENSENFEIFVIENNTQQIKIKNLKIGTFNKIFITDLQNGLKLDTILVKTKSGLENLNKRLNSILQLSNSISKSIIFFSNLQIQSVLIQYLKPFNIQKILILNNEIRNNLNKQIFYRTMYHQKFGQTGFNIEEVNWKQIYKNKIKTSNKNLI